MLKGARPDLAVLASEEMPRQIEVMAPLTRTKKEESAGAKFCEGMLQTLCTKTAIQNGL
jgi:hypothetical protein